MADHSINLTIGSKFKGEGFAEARKSITDLSQGLVGGSKGAADLAKGLGTVGSMLGGIGQTLTGAVGDFFRGNFLAAGIRVFDLVIEKTKEYERLLKDAALAARGLSREYMGLEAMAKGYQKRVAEWRREKAEADKEEAENAKAKLNAEKEAMNIERERLAFEQKYYTLQNQIADEVERAKTANAEDLDIIKAKVDEMNRAAALAVKIAEQNLAYAKQYGSGYEQNIAEQELQLAKARQERIAAEAQKLIDAYVESQLAHKEETKEVKQVAQKAKEQQLTLKDGEAAQRAANDAAEKLAAAQREYAELLRNYNSAKNLTTLAAQSIAGRGGIGGKPGLLPVDVQKSIQTTVSDQKVDDAIRNGAVGTVKEMGRLQRQAMREARDAISKNQGEQLREAQRYKRLQEMNPRALASADVEFMRKYERLLAHQKEQRDKLKAAADAQKEAEENAKKLVATAQEIAKKLDKLGLQ